MNKKLREYVVINCVGEMTTYESESIPTLTYRLQELYDVVDSVILPWKLYWFLREHHTNQWIYDHYRVNFVKDREDYSIPHPESGTQPL
jgi:hypothetical protein